MPSRRGGVRRRTYWEGAPIEIAYGTGLSIDDTLILLSNADLFERNDAPTITRLMGTIQLGVVTAPEEDSGTDVQTWWGIALVDPGVGPRDVGNSMGMEDWLVTGYLRDGVSVMPFWPGATPGVYTWAQGNGEHGAGSRIEFDVRSQRKCENPMDLRLFLSHSVAGPANAFGVRGYFRALFRAD